MIIEGDMFFLQFATHPFTKNLSQASVLAEARL